MTAFLDHVPPHSDESEKAVLGGMMFDRQACGEALGIVKPEDFYLPDHQKLATVISELHASNSAVDPVTVLDALQSRDWLDAIEVDKFDGTCGVDQLRRMMELCISAAAVEDYARIVKHKAILRRFIGTAGECIRDAYDEGQSFEEFCADAGAKILAITEHASGGGEPKILRDVLRDTFAEIEAAARGELRACIPSGFYDLDSNYLNGGLPKSGMIVIAARPSVGKSALAVNMAHNMSMAGHKGAIFSVEMRYNEIALRLLAAQSHVPMQRIGHGQCSEENMGLLIAAAGELGKLPLRIETECATMPAIRGACRKLRQRDGLDFVVIDYLQRLTPWGNAQNREQEVSQDAHICKCLAKELDCPVIVCCQLNRETEKGNGRKARLSDIRESGAIEQDADVVLLLDRDLGQAETQMQVAKARNARTGVIDLVFVGERCQFESVSRAGR
jgi:replicative DNA helicase